MKSTNAYEQLKADISNQEKIKAKSLAKSKGMTFQGWIGQLIRTELRRNESKEA